MIALLAFVALDGLKQGDTWSFERTYRYVNEAEGVDLGDVEVTRVTVADLRPTGYDLGLARRVVATKLGETRTPVESPAPWERLLKFGTNGQPIRPPEDTEHHVRARIDRMLWTASENRRGVSWSRTWPLNETLPEGKATAKPIGNGKLSLTYTETGGLRAEGTAMRDVTRPVIVEMSITINRAFLPKGTVPVSVVVKQTPASP